MTLAELIPYVADGHVVLVAEVRGGKLETVGYVDKKSGEKIARLQLSLAVERQGQGMVGYALLQRYFPSSARPDESEIKLEKGQLYAFLLDSHEIRRGTFIGRFSGKPAVIDKGLEPLGPPEAGQRPNLVYNQTAPHENDQK